MTRLLALAALLVAGSVSAEPKAPRPFLCSSFRVVVDAAEARRTGVPMLGLCLDGKRAKVVRHWMPVVINDGSTDHSYFVSLP